MLGRSQNMPNNLYKPLILRRLQHSATVEVGVIPTLPAADENYNEIPVCEFYTFGFTFR
jgi:hypothetical protein